MMTLLVILLTFSILIQTLDKIVQMGIDLRSKSSLISGTSGFFAALVVIVFNVITAPFSFLLTIFVMIKKLGFSTFSKILFEYGYYDEEDIKNIQKVMEIKLRNVFLNYFLMKSAVLAEKTLKHKTKSKSRDTDFDEVFSKVC